MKWVPRFNGPERLMHLVVVVLFLILLLTGLCLHVGVIRDQLGESRFLIRSVHQDTVLILMILPWILIVIWRQKLGGFFKEMTHWRQIEADWLRRETKAAHKFNGGQKLNFLLAMIWLLGLAITGFFIWQSQLISETTREFLYAWHEVLFYLITIQIGGHVFYAAIYKPTRHALHGMLHGRVEEKWARKHHPLWVKEVEKADEGTNTRG